MQVVRNEVNVEYHVSKYVEIITSLREEITQLKSQFATNTTSTNVLDPSIYSKFDAVFDGLRVEYEKLMDITEQEKLNDWELEWRRQEIAEYS
jgi:hypothetical protein